jgi:predicted dehydrogenase/threonine dehydrogenase-like Zn-dependent dehydrogenase
MQMSSCDGSIVRILPLSQQKLHKTIMKQVLQNLRDGDTVLETVPVPVPGANEVLIRSACSLVSAGTEKMLVDFGKASLLDKARSQPDKVKMVFDKLRSDGIVTTVKAVQKKLAEPIPLGYCNVGQVVETGGRVTRFAPGDWVVSNGQHAEYVSVGENLCAKLPDGVAVEQAAFTVLGAIAMQGIRLANPTLGETVVVYGLGLIGQIAARLLRANGCRVLGFDVNAQRVALASRQGVEAHVLAAESNAVAVAMAYTGNAGVDAVLVTASTSSDELMHDAAQMCRKRGRIVLVGVTGLNLRREDFYQKELSFQVSCSYGPGRYDPNYELKGQDYPLAFVRWTEQRNFEAILDLLQRDLLQLDDLITHRFAFDEAVDAYDALSSGQALGILLQYAGTEARETAAAGLSHAQRQVVVTRNVEPIPRAAQAGSVAFIGAGNYATSQLMPAFKKTAVKLHTVVSQKGISAVRLAKQFGVTQASTSVDDVFVDDNIDTLVISTRHDTHASFVVRAIEAGKHIFVEKPLCMTADELAGIDAARIAYRFDGQLTVGFNRRFAPLVQQMQQRLAPLHGPRQINMLVNALAIDNSHWTQDPHTGGGRIIGEACHFIDLARFLAGSPIASVHASAGSSAARISDNCVITLTFDNGSVASISYFSGGHRGFAKETVSVFCEGKVLHLDNYRSLRGEGWKDLRKLRSFQQDKGQQAFVSAFVAAIRGGKPSPISYAQIQEVMRATLEASRQIGA